ncbi:MAG TPA: phosphoglucosamine mutase [Chromatiaceae bacterium]|nr:phosphoglucosamine mutase [Chromatiaceae bacterium]HIN81511.1 phosphoglucosamine mutase [Chromatiales bacterium]HIO53875.1 phosphoglucosamine mutase [Chromatiales bacterium]
MKKQYFGTDGIRGRVGETPITAEFMLKLGWAVGRVLGRHGSGKVVIGKDTRISGYMFESALEAGLSAAGANIRLLGPMPTPAVAYLTRALHASAGIVISASHNPHEDNGIKFFNADGTKLHDDIELAIEAEIAKPMETVSSADLGKADRVVDAAGRYIEFCKSTVPSMMDLSGLTIVVDCAHGATYHVAPSVFEELGANVVVVGVQPNGLNINADCGSTAPAQLRDTVMAHKADLGIGFDGDGDRVVMVDHLGNIVDGDELLYVIARSRQDNGKLKGNVVGTLMSNLGFEHGLKALGITLDRVNVGDRYVMERLVDKGWTLGGENSGHLICLDRTTTGDGIVSGLQVIAEIVLSGKSLNELKSGMVKYPQTLINVRIQQRVDINAFDSVSAAVIAAEARLGDSGRVLLRPSGTEPLIRVMVEGRDEAQVQAEAQFLANAVREAVEAHCA